MLSPTPVTLFCALLLCLPLAVVFTFTATPITTSTSKSTDIPSSSFTPIITTTINLNRKTHSTKKPISNPIPITKLTVKTQEKPHNESSTVTVSPPPADSMTYDDEDDESLFQLAGRVNPKPKPSKAPKKVAFMFLTTTPLPFAPLWELYFNATHKNLYNIYIHADPSFNYSPPFDGVFAHRVIPSKPTRRHTSTLASAARRLLANALLHDTSNYMFALLSQSCIPLHSFKFTYETLRKSKKSFIEILKNEVGAYDRWAARGESAMLPEVKFESFRIGSQFFVLTRRHARVVVRDRRLWSKFKLPCVNPYTCYPEENYFPTLLRMVDPRGCVPATLTHVDWRESHGGHPHTYCADEVGPDLIKTLRNGRPRYGDDGTNRSNSSVTSGSYPFLFARKFVPEAIKALMSMASEVILKD